MVSTGERAPNITATIGNQEPEAFELTEHLEEGPVVLAFFPGAFTPPCTNEMITIQDRLDEFEAAGATVVGISADSPFCQHAFGNEHDIEFNLVSDMDGDAITAYELSMDLPELGLYEVANRAVFVLDSAGTITYRWVAEDPTNEPPYDEVLKAVTDAV